MTLTPIKTPVVAKKMFPNYVWDMATSDKTLYLTFDDGPTPEITNWVLSTLKQYNAKASFFCIGDNVKKHTKLFQQIISEGHAIGNHTQNHLKGWKTTSKDYLKNVEACDKVFKSEMIDDQSQIVNLFRPPYGKITPKQGKKLIKLGYKIIMWDVLSFDWDKNISPNNCLNNVITKAKPGSIVVFHDSVKASKNMMYALPKVLEHFRDKGYRFKSLS